MTRTLSKESLALRHALACHRWPGLRKEALAIVLAVIDDEQGNTERIAERLGIGRSTYSRWVQTVAEIDEAHHGWHKERR